MKTKSIAVLLVGCISLGFLAGCQEESDEVKLARIQANAEVRIAEANAEVMEEMYENDGYRGDRTIVHHNDNSGTALVAGMAMGAMIANSYQPTYQPVTRIVDGRTYYYSRDNKRISRTEYDRRKKQSAADKARYQAKLKAEQKAKAAKEKQHLKNIQAKNKASMSKQAELKKKRELLKQEIAVKKSHQKRDNKYKASGSYSKPKKSYSSSSSRSKSYSSSKSYKR